MSNKVTFITQKLKHSLDRKGYLNINHIQVEGRKKLAEISYLFRNPDYQTFRILYIKDNYIVGEEIITTKILHNSKRGLQISDNGITRAEKCIYRIRDRMRMLQANKYLLIHNSPLERLLMSKEQLDTSTYFYTYLDGFMGHLIINSKAYLWVDIYKNNVYITNKKIKKGKKTQKYALSNMYMKSKKDIINLVSNLFVSNNHSIIVITKIGETPKILLDIPNICINQKNKSLKKYLDSLRYLYKESKIILVTDNGNIFKESLGLLLENTINDTIWYTELQGNLYMYNLPNLNKYREYINLIKKRGNKIERTEKRRSFANII